MSDPYILGTTGHRNAPPSAAIIAQAALEQLRPDTVITGMAQGWDTYIAEACVRLGIPFRAYIPGEWHKRGGRYAELLWMAETVRCCTHGPYNSMAFQIRNMTIVDDSTALLTWWDGRMGSGTYNCVSYARQVVDSVPCRPVINVWRAL